MVERAIGNCAIDAGTATSWREPLGRMYFSSDKDSFACTYTVSTACRKKRKKEEEKKKNCSQHPYRYTERGVERDPIKLISTVPILICCPEIIPFHRVNSLVLFDSRYTR